MNWRALIGAPGVAAGIGAALLFGVGTTAGMMLVTSAIAAPFMRADRLPSLNFGLQLVAGALSLGLGCYLAWRLGVAGGVFVAATAH